MDPPGYSKLAFDPTVFTGVSQADRRAALLKAFDGRMASLTSAADRFGMSTIVLAKLNGLWGTFDPDGSGDPAVEPGAVRGPWSIYEGNGWDALELPYGSRRDADRTCRPGRSISRCECSRPGRRAARGRTSWPWRRTARSDCCSTSRSTGPAPRGLAGDRVVRGAPAGEVIRIDALASLFVQSVRGYVPPPAVPDGWVVRSDGPDTVVLDRAGS
jgi:hypothetical protein